MVMMMMMRIVTELTEEVCLLVLVAQCGEKQCMLID